MAKRTIILEIDGTEVEMVVEKTGPCRCGGKFSSGHVDNRAIVLHSVPPCDPYTALNASEFLGYLQNAHKEPN